MPFLTVERNTGEGYPSPFHFSGLFSLWKEILRRGFPVPLLSFLVAFYYCGDESEEGFPSPLTPSFLVPLSYFGKKYRGWGSQSPHSIPFSDFSHCGKEYRGRVSQSPHSFFARENWFGSAVSKTEQAGLLLGARRNTSLYS